jgi:predicted amidohydrolase YtcJ
VLIVREEELIPTARSNGCMIESGAQVVLGPDFPVPRFDPREGFAATRRWQRPCSARAPYDDRRLSALDALHGSTTWAAAAVGEKGALRIGAGADLTNFAVDPVECPADDLVDNPILVAVVDVAIVLRAI